MHIMKLILISGIASLAGYASAGTFITPNAPIAIPDNSGGSMVCQNVIVPNSLRIQRVEAVTAITHTWIGDLTVELTSPAGTRLTTMNRPGNPATTFGADDDFSSSSPILFSDMALSGISAEQMGASCSGVIGLTCGPDNYLPAPDVGGTSFPGHGTDFVDFIGENAAGTWTLCVADSASGDTGTLTSWALSLGPEDPTLSLPTEPSNNGTGGVFLRIQPTTHPLILTSFETPTNGTENSPVTIQVWTRPGSYAGFTDSGAGWTLSQTVHSVAVGSNDVPVPFMLTMPIHLPAGTTTSIYLHSTSEGGLRYTGTSGLPPQTSWTNQHLSMVSDVSRTGRVAFEGSSFTPRAFSGRLHYQLPGDRIFPNGFEHD